MKIGITQIVLGKRTLAETLSLCQEAGYEAVELVFTQDKDLDLGMSPSELAGVRQRCATAGVEISSVIANYADRGNLMSRHPAEREKCARCLARSLEIAGAVGAGAVLLHPGQLTVEGTYEEAWNDLRDVLREMSSLAARMGAAIGLENVWNRFLLSPREARSFVEEVGSPWVGIYLDTANMMAYGYPEHWIRSLGRHIRRVHLKDFVRREHRFVNLLEGDTDWAAVMGELRRAGYDSALVHEVGGDHQALVDLGERMRRIVALG
ncbi:MAG: sugar phosphate isomerase/epimerase family protein [Candidatus Latescibacterota bacterium]